MKTLIAVLAMSLSFPVFATQYTGKKFKMTITKQPDGQRVVEGEVWDTTKTEHLLIINTKPAENIPVEVDPRWDIRPK